VSYAVVFLFCLILAGCGGKNTIPKEKPLKKQQRKTKQVEKAPEKSPCELAADEAVQQARKT